MHQSGERGAIRGRAWHRQTSVLHDWRPLGGCDQLAGRVWFRVPATHADAPFVCIATSHNRASADVDIQLVKQPKRAAMLTVTESESVDR